MDGSRGYGIQPAVVKMALNTESLALTSQNGNFPRIYSREEHRISRRQIDPDALKVMYRLLRNGFKAHLVGGGVRDLLLNKTPKDFDIATDATPRRIKALFRNSRIIGRRFKLAHVIFGAGKVIEVATFRDTAALPEPEGEESDGPTETSQIVTDNVFGSEETDALRRDITINALFYDLSNFSIIDYVGGMADLKSKLIRVIGNPDVRFTEDPVRLLRVIRHAVRAGFEVEEQCWESLRRNRTLINNSPAVRVYDELRKDFVSGHIADIIIRLEAAGLLELLAPELTSSDAFVSQADAFLASLRRIDALKGEGPEVQPTVVLAVMALFSNRVTFTIDELEQEFCDNAVAAACIESSFSSLAVPRRERDRISDLILLWMKLVHVGEAAVRTSGLLRRAGTDDFQCFLTALYGSDAAERTVEALSSRQVEPSRSGRQRRRRRRSE